MRAWMFVMASTCLVVAQGSQVEQPTMDDRQMEMLVKTYPNFFVRKREEQKAFIQRMQQDADYEKRYKMFEMAFKNILKMFAVEEKNLAAMEHTDGVLPQNAGQFQAVATILENVCLIGEIVLHFPDMSYRILDSYPTWRDQVHFGTGISQQYSFVFDQSTKEMLSLFNQEINPDQRSDDYRNPYADAEESAPKKSKKGKQKKAARKGPRLQEL